MPEDPKASTDTSKEGEKTTDQPSEVEDGINMAVKVYSPFKTYYEGMALSVSAASKTGDFDILPKHHNFITLLVACDLVVRTDKEDETIPITGGIMHVKADQVTVFLDV